MVSRAVTSFTNPLEASPTVVSRAVTFPSTFPTRPSNASTVVLSALSSSAVASALPSSAVSNADSSTLLVTAFSRSFSALFVAYVTLATSLLSLSVSSLWMFSLFVAMSFVFLTTSVSFALLSSAVLSALSLSSVSTFSAVYTSAVPGTDSATCTVPFAALATPNPPQRRESAIRDARREGLVTPPNFSEPEADFV